MYQSLDHPKTIALRVEVEDDDTGMPLAGVRVSVEGEWEKEKRWGGVITAEFELGAVTDRKGIAVFGLSWNDSRGGKKDDIEKVSQVLVRRDGYQQVSRRISFSSLVRTSNDYNRDGWMDIVIQTPGARYFVLMLGEGFKDFENEGSQNSAFFELVRQEKYGEVFRAKEKTEADFPRNFIMATPQKEAGPFMMLPVKIGMNHKYRLASGARHDMI